MHEEVNSYTVCFVVTSDSVYYGQKSDEVRGVAAKLIELCPSATLAGYEVVANDVDLIRAKIMSWLDRCDVMVVSGGTGIGNRDVSVEAVAPLARKEVPGFGELFRALSFREVGFRAYLSRASAYVIGRSLVFVVPGNPKAVELALRDIICHMVAHALYELRRS